MDRTLAKLFAQEYNAASLKQIAEHARRAVDHLEGHTTQAESFRKLANAIDEILVVAQD